MNNDIKQPAKWSENVIIADADFIDNVAFNLIVNFERMIGRRIPKADMPRWIDCIALDGGVREGDNETQVVLIHSKKSTGLQNFTPSSFADELDGKAFKDHLGEFVINSYPVEDMVSKDDFIADAVKIASGQKQVRRLMVITSDDACYDKVRQTLRHVDDDDKRITLFAMQPMPGGNFRQEILGYSLMNALGIRSDEIKC